MSAVTFIADLHLRPEAPEGMAALARLLASLPSGDALWILGDLFEFWAGRGHALRSDYRPALDALKAAAGRGVAVRFLAGNRDFLLDARTQRELGMAPFTGRETVLETQGRRVYLAHGDFLCPNDRAYLRAAALLRNPVSLWIERHLPFPLAYQAAAAFRSHSEAKRGKGPAPPGTYELSEAMLAEAADRHGATDLVVGHVHAPVDRPLAGTARPATLHVLDPWHGDRAFSLRLEGGRFSRGTL